MASKMAYRAISFGNAATWTFPDNQNGEIKGFNDAGVSTFDGNTLRSMVRESIQNSLDAALKPGVIPVKVEFDLFKISSGDIPDGKKLRYAFRQCKDFAKKGDKAHRFFSQAIDDMKKPVPILRISDHGTTGLRGAESGSISSDWSRLVKQSGSSSKNDLSGGSYGIGKYASFACSAMRTVFFASMDDKGIESSIGVARLTSFEDGRSITSGIGYYSDNENNNAILRPLSFPNALRRDRTDPGTDIYILDCVKTAHIMRTIEYEALYSFLVSIWKGLLVLDIGGKIIDNRNLARIIGELNDEDDDEREIIEHFSLLIDGTEGVHKIVLDPAVHQYAHQYGYPKGSATLYLKQGNGLDRCVMMTRSQGMRLFSQKNISGTIQFTGILMIEGKKMNEDFREMEAPSHDKWEPERAKKPGHARQCYKGLRQWIREEVLGAFSRDAEEQIDAFNVGLYLPASKEVETTIRNRTPNRKPDREAPLRRKRTRVRKRQLNPKGLKDEQTKPEFEEDVTSSFKHSAGKRNNSPKSKSGNKNQNANALLDGLTQMHIRARAMSTSTAGVYQLKFVVPRNVSRFTLKLYCKGEIGRSDLGIQSANVTRGNVSIAGIQDNCIGFGECRKGEVVELEMASTFNRYCMFGVEFYAAK